MQARAQHRGTPAWTTCAPLRGDPSALAPALAKVRAPPVQHMRHSAPRMLTRYWTARACSALFLPRRPPLPRRQPRRVSGVSEALPSWSRPLVWLAQLAAPARARRRAMHAAYYHAPALARERPRGRRRGDLPPHSRGHDPEHAVEHDPEHAVEHDPEHAVEHDLYIEEEQNPKSKGTGRLPEVHDL